MNIKYILIILILTMVPLYITGLNASDNQKKNENVKPTMQDDESTHLFEESECADLIRKFTDIQDA